MTTPYQKKHQEIVNAAIDVFLEKGFLLTSMDAVSARAGISKVTVYNHFRDKRQLFEHVMMVHCRSLGQGKKLISYEPDKPLKLILSIYAKKMVDLLLHERSIALMRVVIGDAGRFPDLGGAIWPGGSMPMHEEFADYLKAEQAAQRLAIPDIGISVRQFFGLIKENLVWPVLMGITLRPTPEHQKAVIEQSVAMFLKFYKKPQ